MERATPAEAPRTSKAILAIPEKWVLTRVAARLPGWVLPDHLTLLALFAAAGISVSYVLANDNPQWLWGASLGLVLHWFGDSLDGTLARVRKIERPRYGFYVDHLCDALATVAIGVGLGLSAFMLLSVGLAIVIAYLVLSINVYLETLVVQKFRYGYGVVGPTEARILLIALNTMVLIMGPVPFNLLGIGATIFDVIGIAVALGMVAMLAKRTFRNLRQLAEAEPANRPR